MASQDSETIAKPNRALELIDIAQKGKNKHCTVDDAIEWLRTSDMNSEADELEQVISDLSERDVRAMDFCASLRAATRGREN